MLIVMGKRREVIAPYPLAALFDVDGVVISGKASRFAVDSAGESLCAVSGTDAVGYIEDLSGNGNHFTQSGTGFKGLYRVGGGVKSVDVGPLTSAGLARFLNTAARVADEFTLYCVYRQRSVAGATYDRIYPFLAYEAAWPANYGLSAFADNALGNAGMYWEGIASDNAGPCHASDAASCGAFKWVKRGNMAAGFDLYGDAALPLPTPWNRTNYPTADTSGIVTFNPLTLGFPETLSTNTAQVAFFFLIQRALTAGEQTTVETHIGDEFAGWVG